MKVPFLNIWQTVPPLALSVNAIFVPLYRECDVKADNAERISNGYQKLCSSKVPK